MFTFQNVKSQEIIRRIKASEKEVNEAIERTEAAQRDERAKANEPSEDEYMLLEEDLSDIIADVHDLAKFVQVNYTGFYKIIKKHDVSAPITRESPTALTILPENDGMVLETGLRCTIESQALLQGEL